MVLRTASTQAVVIVAQVAETIYRVTTWSIAMQQFFSPPLEKGPRTGGEGSFVCNSERS